MNDDMMSSKVLAWILIESTLTMILNSNETHHCAVYVSGFIGLNTFEKIGYVGDGSKISKLYFLARKIWKKKMPINGIVFGRINFVWIFCRP